MRMLESLWGESSKAVHDWVLLLLGGFWPCGVQEAHEGGSLREGSCWYSLGPGSQICQPLILAIQILSGLLRI